MDINKNSHIKTERFLNEYYRHLEQKLGYKPEYIGEQRFRWKQAVREKANELMKFPDNGDMSGNADLIWSEQRNGYRIEKHIIYPEPYSAVPFLILIPDSIAAGNSSPAVICIAGSSGTKELLANEPELDGKPSTNKHLYHNRMAWHFVQAGFTAVALENPGVGELKNDEDDIWNDRGDFSARMLMMGRNYVGISVHQKLCIIEWMKKQRYINPEQIAVSSHSLGAEAAAYLGIISDDIKAVIYNDFSGNRLKRKISLRKDQPIGGYWHEIPDMFEWFTYVDLLAANSPKPLLLNVLTATPTSWP
ncbi:MAG TPA: alpha/beta hydrolase family protein, partial [Clostridia bacterium]|nr:alpha/beta hydrolase family protein [Clostridia bacterium]